MVVRADRRLVHAGDHGRPKRRADRRRRIGVFENDAFPREPVHVWRVDQLLSLVAEVTGHIVYHDPDDVRPLGGDGCRWDVQEQEADYYMQSMRSHLLSFSRSMSAISTLSKPVLFAGPQSNVNRNTTSESFPGTRPRVTFHSWEAIVPWPKTLNSSSDAFAGFKAIVSSTPSPLPV